MYFSVFYIWEISIRQILKTSHATIQTAHETHFFNVLIWHTFYLGLPAGSTVENAINIMTSEVPTPR